MLNSRWRSKLPKGLWELASVFRKNGFECYLVGGAIRNLLLGRVLGDLDIATDARPDQVGKAFRRVVPTGIKHGTVTVFFRGRSYEVTTFRIDGVYSDARHPDAVTYSASILEDLERRDFTINGMAYDLLERRLLDPHGGREDLRVRTIRAVGDPAKRFREDALRTLRACRFAAQLGFRIEEQTFQAIRRERDRVKRVSAERIRDELLKIVQSDGPVLGFELLEGASLLSILLPELHACVGVEQGPPHRHDVFHHSLHSCAAAPPDDLVLRLAALFHDIGKAPTAALDEEGARHFHRHERVSADLAGRILRRLKLPTAAVREVCHLVEHHMFDYKKDWSDAAVRRLVARVGWENMPRLIQLRMADQRGMGGRSSGGLLLELLDRIEEAASREEAVSMEDLRVDGTQIMERLGLQPGPKIGVILRFLLEAVIDDPALNSREKLLDMARRFHESHLKNT